MNFLTNMRISHKISALMVALVFGFIVIGVTYYIQVRIENSTLASEHATLEFRNQLAQVNEALSHMSASAQSYWRNPNEENQQALAQSLKKIKNQLDEYLNTASEPEQADTFKSLTRQLAVYQDQFERVSTQQQSIGYDEESGLQGQTTQSVNSINALLIQFNQPQLISVAKALASDDSSTEDAYQLFSELLASTNIPEVAGENLEANFRDYVTNMKNLNNAKQELNALGQTWFEQAQLLSSGAAQALAKTASQTSNTTKNNIERRQIVQAIVTAIIFAVAIGTAVGVYFLYKSIVFPMAHMQSVIGKINRGKTGTRVKVLTSDELGDLGSAFNRLLDERIKQLEERSLENEQLNNSIISLIRALGVIAQRDLTVKVPVSADITGTISDAVNLLTSETAKTLQDVKGISNQINRVSEKLQQQSQLVTEYADGEKRQIVAAAKALEMLASAMNEVARNAEQADTNAAKAIESTQQARHSVEETVGGIRAIRETISETEKRTKRLGERSQEISGIVNLINTIAERTHILALNASMHAASAGEAGRGFAVVADEVQRLAESARQSTDEIAAMVNNMRVETSDTVTIMSKLISQVAEGSQLAELAGKRMADTETATQSLVEDVKHIAEQAVQQAEIANRVRDRSSIIRKFSDKTGQQLQEQKHQTNSLKQFADSLVQQVNVFTLPATESSVFIDSESLVSEKTVAEKTVADNTDNRKRGDDTAEDNISPLQAAG